MEPPVVPLRTPTKPIEQMERVGSDHGFLVCVDCGLIRFGFAMIGEVRDREQLGSLVGPCTFCGQPTSRGIGLDRIHDYAEKK